MPHRAKDAVQQAAAVARLHRPRQVERVAQAAGRPVLRAQRQRITALCSACMDPLLASHQLCHLLSLWDWLLQRF